jgi:hypothetical protein
VGAGGNVGAVLAGLLFGAPEFWPTALLIIGVGVCAASFLALSLYVKPEEAPAPVPKYSPVFDAMLPTRIETAAE